MIIYDPILTGSLNVNGTPLTSIESIDTVSGSVVDLTLASGSFSSRVTAAEESVNSLNSASSSYLLNSSDTLDGDLTVTGRITAQEFHTEFVSASIIYESGSTKFGDTSDDTHIFSGSIDVSNGILGTLSTAAQTNVTSLGTLSSLNVTGDVGIGTSSTQYKTQITSTSANNVTDVLALHNGSNAAGTGTGARLLFKLANFETTVESRKYASIEGISTSSNNESIDLVFKTQPSATSGDPAERMRINSNGFFGMGGSINSWNTLGNTRAIQMRRTALWEGYDNSVVSNNMYFDGTNVRYINPAAASRILFSSSGDITLSNAPSGTSGDTVTLNERLRIDANGKVGIGTNSPRETLDVSGNISANAIFINDASANDRQALYINASNDLVVATGTSTGDRSIIFATENIEQARINSGGNLGIGTTSPAQKLDVNGNTKSAAYHSTSKNYEDSNFIADLDPTLYGAIRFREGSTVVGTVHGFGTSWVGGSSVGMVNIDGDQGVSIGSWNNPLATFLDGTREVLIAKTGTNIDNVGYRLTESGQLYTTTTSTVNTYHLYDTTNNTYRFYVSGTGTIHATNTTISGISDARLKENIQDLTGGLNAVLSLKPRTFDWKEGSGQVGKKVKGFIAQEVEEIFPDLVDDYLTEYTPEDGVPYKSVRQDFMPIVIKAIQELKAENDSLKARIEALEG